MGKPTGFIEFEREIATDRGPMERVKDWNEFHDHLSRGTNSALREQGAWIVVFPFVIPARSFRE